jgi:GH24 family phage-related lysozyme (muramidase)
MSRISREGFVESLRPSQGEGGLRLTPELEAKMQRAGIDAGVLRRTAGEDGVVDTREELGRLFDLIDSVDHDGSYRSIRTSTRDGGLTASGEAIKAILDQVGDARTAARLGGRPMAAVAGPTPGLTAEEIFADLQQFEGSVSHMYQDTRGYVTVGVGHLLRTAADAEKLPFINASTGQPATRAEIRAAFDQVAAMDPGKRSSSYKLPDGLVLPETTARELAQGRVEREFLPGLRRLYPEFDSFPPRAKLALIDMAYNLGVGGLGKFSHLKEAVNRQDWAAAAEHCNRRTSREERNEWTRQMFNEAAQVAVATRGSRVD